MKRLYYLPMWVLWFFIICLSSCSSNDNIETSDFIATIYNEGPDLKVRYDLPAPQSELLFSNRDRSQRALGWHLSDNGFEFDGQKLYRTDGTLFDSVTFDLVRDPRFFNRRYVVIDDIGPKGWSVYLPAFQIDNQDTDIIFKSEEPLILRIGADAHKLERPYRLGDKSMMAYFGLSQYVKTDKAIIIAGPDMPSWLIDDVRTGVSQTISRLENGFEIPPLKKPTLYLTTHKVENGRSIKGGQLDDAVMTFRYRNVDFSKVDEDLKNELTNTSAHEAAHLWIGGIYKNTRNEEEPWVNEGGTEYLADRTRYSSQQIIEEFELRLNNCLIKIGTNPLDGSQGSVQGSLVYDCGYVLHAAAESAALSKTNSNIMDIWKAMISGLQTQDTSYSPSDFLQTVDRLSGPEYRAFSAPFLTGVDSARWDDFLSLAREVGLELKASNEQPIRNSQVLIGRWLMPLLAANCEGGYGFYDNQEAKKLDASNCSPPFENGQDIVSVANVSLISDPLKALETVRTLCSNNNELVLGLIDGTKLSPVPCSLDIAPLPPRFKVVKFPDLPLLIAE